MSEPQVSRTRVASAGAADRQLLSDLLTELGSGDRSALAELYRRTSAKLYGICLRLMRNESDAQDVLQDVYLTVWRRAGSFDADKSSPITWLSVVARNKAIDRLRRVSLPTVGVEAADDVADDKATAVEIIEQGQQHHRLNHCLEELDEKQRNAVRTAFFTGASYRELAERDSVPLGTMKSWIRRALLSLRECLER